MYRTPLPGLDMRGPVPRFQRCICRTVMLTIAPRTHFACRYRHVCVYCLLECLVCACNDVVPAFWRQRPCPHACTARPHHCLHILSRGLEPPGCRSGPRSQFLVGCVVILSRSLSQIRNNPQHPASKDLRCDMDAHPYHIVCWSHMPL